MNTAIVGTGCGMEIRQLKYFVAVAEELHFGHAAAREHIVQSALSQQVRLLEREIGARLLDRNTHQVTLTHAGVAFLAEARSLLMHVDRAATIARRAADEPAVFRVGSTETSHDLMAGIIDRLLAHHPDVEVNQFETVVSQQYDMLSTGQLDVGVGCASLAPGTISSYQFRQDPMGVLVSEDHPFANEARVTVGELQGEHLLFGPEGLTPEHDALVLGMCRQAGFTPRAYAGRVQNVFIALSLIRSMRCAFCTPRSVWHPSQGVRWIPLIDPEVAYPWSVLWHSDDHSSLIDLVVATAKELTPTDRR
jgi:DNA-binding transcriptional LysR family regulator